MAPVKVTLSDIAQRLELKGEKFVVHSVTNSCDIAQVWGKLKEIDPALSLSAFMRDCCHERYYFFDIKKYGDEDCTICLPPRLSPDKFSQLDHLPMPGTDGYYKKFSEVFQTTTVENHRPSLQNITKKHLPFYPSEQYVKNYNMM